MQTSVLIIYNPKDEAQIEGVKYISENLRRKNVVTVLEQHDYDGDVGRFDAVLLGDTLWFDKLSKEAKNFALRLMSDMPDIPVYLFIFSYLSEPKFKAALKSNLHEDFLSNVVTFNMGFDIDPGELSPINKLKWKLTRQEADTSMSVKYVQSLVNSLLKDLNVK